MRIRRRPPPPPPPPPLISTTMVLDPSPPHQEESETTQVHEQRDGLLLLHQDGDLLHLGVGKGLPSGGSDPSPSHLPSSCISPTINFTTHVQMLEEEEEEEQVNSNKSNFNGCDGEPEEKTIVGKKNKAEYMRAKASSSSNGSDEYGKKEKRRRRSPAVLMEGSRCSRVNGRGWRCCQPTLVGYSLCEHHLGKGARLRSVSSMRGRLGCSTKKGVGDGPSIRKKIATTVKARSISSLLGVESDDNTHSESLSSSSSPPPLPNASTISKGQIGML